jgi:hypothetical protein
MKELVYLIYEVIDNIEIWCNKLKISRHVKY